MDNKWQDRPDKAGEWWISRMSKISGKRIKPHHITVSQSYIDGDFDYFIGAKWLYIPEPELPEREQLNQKIFQSESKYGYSQFE